MQRRSDDERKALVREYRKATRATSGQTAKRVQFTKYVIKDFYGRATDVSALEIAIRASERFWAEVSPQKNADGKYPFTVNEDFFDPGNQGGEEATAYIMASTIGHELIHLEQFSRPSNGASLGINDAVYALRELEASTWESENTDFRWKIPANTLYRFLRADYKQGVDELLQERRKQVEAAVREFHTSALSAKYLPTLIRWLNANSWTREVWLPANRELLGLPAEQGTGQGPPG